MKLKKSQWKYLNLCMAIFQKLDDLHIPLLFIVEKKKIY